MRALPLGIILLLACGESTPDGWSGTVETLPDGRTRVRNPPAAVWDVEGAWTLAPAARIGALEGDGADVFSAVSGLEVGADGRIYVLDRQANELRIFAPDGSHVRTVGRSGGGPGEFTNANGLAWMAGDTLLVVDQRGNRYSVLTPAGDFVRSVPRGLGFYGWVYTGTWVDGRIWELTTVGPDLDNRRPALLGTPLDASVAPTATEEGSRPVLAGASDTIFLPDPDLPAYEAYSIQTDRGGMVMAVPFTPRSLYHVDPAGTLWHGHGGEPRVYRSTLDGDTLLEVSFTLDPAPVSQTEIDAFAAGPGIERFKSLGGDLDLSRIPEHKPFYDAIYVDPDGHVWLSLPTTPGATAFAVLDPDGRFLGRLDLPGVDRDVFLQPVVRSGRLHFVGRDELDVQSVHVYEVNR